MIANKQTKRKWQFTRMSSLVTLFRVLLGVLFLFTGILKFMDLPTFADAVHKFELIPHEYNEIFSVIIPSLEIICGLFLVLGIFAKGSMNILLVLMAMFTIAIGITLEKGITFDCSCFGFLQKYMSEDISGWSILVNLWIIGAIVLTYLKMEKSKDLFTEIFTVGVLGLFLTLAGNLQMINSNLLLEVNKDSMEKISYTVALDLMKNNKNVVLFDARTEEEYNEYHFENAVSLPDENFEKYFIKIKDSLSEDTQIIIYCSSSTCGLSDKVGLKLIKKGYDKIFIIQEGIEYWKS